ncbi:hypothetical protein ACRS6Y_04065 [Bacillus cytotoxicus]|uniref:Uncharacterized protein n=1 Tax=Bacillus cytotoxicus (strain DSM 22905 / CIP 110041 / 391-98 / NVH 391-98) TaxID=315749 RepID=A7GVK3_BACCN|nr:MULTISPECIES: hypothetical protein [Bacillus cereus group]ABS24161.1 conserved hypothetical protein [Bacillus cytotoxicus NVH 391-98]AWC34780.1 hypothetical protein CG482_021920 [Bacillus cytotoxicus]AWC38776.1 hypothetical protein CG481_021755 [Bacillus cytotoxicus]AWC46754.1 hypothetical protein CG479_021065 [Bacillus cytotoxicus]AWC62994.1 hypothetical protein CG474_021480 [Bacillus cytotoxicus]
MRNLKEDVVVHKEVKRPIWKKKRFWILGIILILFITSKLGSSIDTPSGIEEDFYKSSLYSFHELNIAIEENAFPDKKVTKWVADHMRAMENYPNDYSEKERMILIHFRGLITSVGLLEQSGDRNMLEEKINEARSNLANILEVEEDY